MNFDNDLEFNKTEEDIVGVYIISVAARLMEMHPQTLRKYDRAGLVRPSRTVGMLRLYSDADLVKLRIIKRLVEHYGINLAGVSLILDLVEILTRILQHTEEQNEINWIEKNDKIEKMINMALKEISYI
ncbi:MAG: MerR family transcriptional regulator [Chloroflexi bacterium]|nr:MerR family transcriptional regulator [Chloroflexota bacterium]|tara:strand:+ start:2891 stop:3277 length:387 start_codon:yes stop_codon:yes gene_type:complete